MVPGSAGVIMYPSCENAEVCGPLLFRLWKSRDLRWSEGFMWRWSWSSGVSESLRLSEKSLFSVLAWIWSLSVMVEFPSLASWHHLDGMPSLVYEPSLGGSFLLVAVLLSINAVHRRFDSVHTRPVSQLGIFHFIRNTTCTYAISKYIPDLSSSFQTFQCYVSKLELSESVPGCIM